ncbi:hypothetical protein KC19_9G146300 [Ceratodon purpureus]|uniref:Ubiquitin thioesterase OTU n=1 Tax=Ceratodon purpureus TaxID=3225 RepID=A0A8T0GVT4_CERPU|nr:hypothetical protein KC19_9G146300 [Ceratodon purpureus]
MVLSMMLKSFSVSASVPGKAYNTVQNYSSFSLRNGGRLKVSSISLTCPQHHPTLCLLAAKIAPTGTSGRTFQQSREISAAFRPSKQLAAAPFSVNRVDVNKNSRVPWAKSSEAFKFSSTNLKATHGKANMSVSSPAPGSPQKLQAVQHRHAPWLLFGLCICLSVAAGSFAPRLLIGSPPAFAEVVVRTAGRPTASGSRCRSSETEESQGKKVHFDYHVTGIPGDGRCLFRAVAHGACLRSGKPAPNEGTQRQMADDLRNKALDELVRRRETSEWFIEGDFDAYVRRMRNPYTWGGEPELLMLSNVLQMPITVYMKHKGGIIAIAEYGQEYGNENPIRVLYHGSGHYEAVQLPGDKRKSRL